MSKEEYAVEVENISKIYTLRNKNNQYKTDTGNFILVMTFVFENTAEHPSTMHGRIYHHTLNATTSHGKYSTVMPLYV